jgi:hypothetical protein
MAGNPKAWRVNDNSSVTKTYRQLASSICAKLPVSFNADAHAAKIG